MVGWQRVMVMAVTWQLCAGGCVGDDDVITINVLVVQ